MSKPKILIFDIETAPNVAHVWQYYKTNVGLNQILDDGEILSFAAKWLDNDEITYVENRRGNDKALVKALHKLIDQADIVVAHNGARFDMGWFRAKAAIHGLTPPSPVKIVDTLRVVKGNFYFPSYKLEYLTRVFKVSEKFAHRKFPGHELWMQCCVHNNDDAWAIMQEYNIQDVIALEEFYLKILPWITNHPNLGVFIESEDHVCPKCGHDELQKRGFQNTNLSKFQRYQCKGCGGWSRGRYNMLDKDIRKELVTNA